MIRSLYISAAISVMLATAAYADSPEWKIDSAHSNAHFSVKHMMVSNVSGDFGKLSGTVKYDGKNLSQASVEANIDVNSVNTREEHRDGHLKSPDFFDAAKFPDITFKSTKIEPGKDSFKIYGDLTLHGVTKPVVLDSEPLSQPIKDTHGNTRLGTTATAKINRRDFGLNFNKTLDNGGAIVGDDVNITLDIEILQKSQAVSTGAGTNKG